MNYDNPIYQELIDLKLIDNKNLIKISNKTRDSNVSVFKDSKEDIIFLQNHVTDINYYLDQKYNYKNKNLFSEKKNKKIKVSTRKGSLELLPIDDNTRRINQFKRYIRNKTLLDFGCGWGVFLNECKMAKKLYGLEIKPECRTHLKKKLPNITIQNKISNFDIKFDTITLFHVLEHVPEQVLLLKSLRSKLNKNGHIIIEVPSAHDFLLSLEKLKKYRDFTFFSEHLILHTEKSLKTMLRAAGFKKIEILFFQRYGFNNHLGWFVENRPGGHSFFNEIGDKQIDNEYKNFLVRKKRTDTLIAIAS